jgi:hypothetical protein
MLARAGIDPQQAIVYELDHFVPLASGGHPRSKTTSGCNDGTASGTRE